MIENMKLYSFRYRIISLLIIFSLSFLAYYYYTPTRGEVQDYFRKECEIINKRLLAQKWYGECGEKILKNNVAIEFEIPHMVKAGRRVLYVYEDEDFHSGGEGMYISGPPERIKISLYHINELTNQKTYVNIGGEKVLGTFIPNDILSYGNYGIPRSELLHVLIDELVSASMEGKQFVNGSASKQEELNAWILAENALKTFYGNKMEIPASFSKPQYGPNNTSYVEVCFFLME
jgi:hypothetical protein